MSSKTALITGITGQDGSYLTELLLQKNYIVHGVIRRSSTFDIHRIAHLYEDRAIGNEVLFLHYGDMTDASSLARLIEQIKPDEIYNLAAQSHVQVSFDLPLYTTQVNALGPLAILDAIRLERWPVRFYQASTSECFGGLPHTVPQHEETPFCPRSPYGVSKMHAYYSVKNYREAYGLFACNGILFNHESPRRGEHFVTRKITRAAAAIAAGSRTTLRLGNLDAKRDWGFAGDYVEGMWRMLQGERPGDYVLATGEAHTVREFATLAFAQAGIPVEWRGEGPAEKAYQRETGRCLIALDPAFLRPAEVEYLLGDASRAERDLGWRRHVDFESLVHMMVEADLRREGIIRG